MMGSCFEQPEGVKEPFATSPAYLEVYPVIADESDAFRD